MLRHHARRRRLVLALTIVPILAAVLGISAVTADEPPEECWVAASSLVLARDTYGATCSLPRIDCDQIDGTWYCSSRVIGDAAPGGVSHDEAGTSAIGRTTTAPPPSTSTTAAPPSTTEAPPSTSTTAAPPSTTEAPPPPSTTAAPPTTTTPGPEGEIVVATFDSTDGPDLNPMKGWNSGWWNDRPEASVGFQYIEWSVLEPENGVFDFEAVEDILGRPGSEDRHLIIRLYCDWWGNEETSRGCPDWIYSEIGVDRIQGDNGRWITDYNDPRYLDEATEAIAALGERYDDDPRLYAVQLGVIGYWGEWHTWGSKIDGEQYEITAETEQRILDAYRSAFDRTRLMARYPYEGVPADVDDLGFHNDYFRPDNGHSADFDDAVADGRRWLDGPIGGEIPPGLSGGDYASLYGTPQGREMIETGRYSTMKPGEVPGGFAGEHLALHRSFGYQYRIAEARFPATAATTVAVEVDLRNDGVAPLYYDWAVQVAVLDDAGTAIAVSDVDVDLRELLPDETVTLAGDLPVEGVMAGEHRVAIRIVQPGADQPKPVRWGLDARHTYVVPASDVPVVDGRWNDEHRLVGGWIVLGTTQVG